MCYHDGYFIALYFTRKNNNNRDGLPVAGGESNLQMLNLVKLSFLDTLYFVHLQWDSLPLGKNSYNKVPALQEYFLFIRWIFLPRPRSKGIIMIVEAFEEKKRKRSNILCKLCLLGNSSYLSLLQCSRVLLLITRVIAERRIVILGLQSCEHDCVE